MKPYASLSLDMDNQWSYMKTHGDPGWESYPSYFGALVPIVLEFLRAQGLKITLFLVGQDAELKVNRTALSLLTGSGHEIGNHSFCHEPWLHLYSKKQVEEEVARAEAAIETATGIRPRGFRGPGFSMSPLVLEVLQERGYLYDATTLPTFLGPLARAYYFFHASNLSKEERLKRNELFGAWTEGLKPVRPFVWKLEGGSLLEIPVTTFPILKIPFHISYVLYLSTFSPFLARTYFRSALLACRALRIEPSVLIHPLDFLGADDVDALSFFPGMKLTGAVKRARLKNYLDDLQSSFEVLPLGEHATELKRRELSARSVRFAT